MPLIRAPVAQPDVVATPSRAALLERLRDRDADERRHAARALSRDPDAARALASRLEHEPDRGVRDALFGSLVEIGGTESANLIARLLRSADAGLRGGAVEALKNLEPAALPVVDALLDEPDPDVRILAIEVTRAWPARLAAPRLRRVIEDDPHLNVCGAAVDVATELGTHDLLAPLARLRMRFPGDTFLAFAVDTACSRIDAATEREG
jgi:HEAT repeat protein